MLSANQNVHFSRGNSAPPELWKYHFTSISLIEEIGISRYVYGLWGELYGCWKVDTSSNRCREFVPTWKLFDDRGIWLSQAETRKVEISDLKNSLASQWLFEANAAFAGLYTEIPRRIRSAVATMGQHQGLALELIWHEPGLAYFFDHHIHERTDQCVFEAFSSLGAEHWDRELRRKLAADILNGHQPEFVIEPLQA